MLDFFFTTEGKINVKKEAFIDIPTEINEPNNLFLHV